MNFNVPIYDVRTVQAQYSSYTHAENDRDFYHNYNRNLHLFVVWQGARDKTDEILSDLETSFLIRAAEVIQCSTVAITDVRPLNTPTESSYRWARRTDRQPASVAPFDWLPHHGCLDTMAHLGQPAGGLAGSLRASFDSRYSTVTISIRRDAKVPSMRGGYQPADFAVANRARREVR